VVVKIGAANLSLLMGNICKEYRWIIPEIDRLRALEEKGKLDYYIIEPVDYNDPQIDVINIRFMDHAIGRDEDMDIARKKYGVYAILDLDVYDKFTRTVNKIFDAAKEVLGITELDFLFPPPVMVPPDQHIMFGIFFRVLVDEFWMPNPSGTPVAQRWADGVYAIRYTVKRKEFKDGTNTDNKMDKTEGNILPDESGGSTTDQTGKEEGDVRNPGV